MKQCPYCNDWFSPQCSPDEFAKHKQVCGNGPTNDLRDLFSMRALSPLEIKQLHDKYAYLQQNSYAPYSQGGCYPYNPYDQLAQRSPVSSLFPWF